jgi:F0F1-type ATP synthase delta subunit
MKYDRAYAHALALTLSNAQTAEAAEERFEQFRASLKRRGHEKLLTRILHEYKRLAIVRERQKRVTLRISDEGDTAVAETAAGEYLSNEQQQRMRTYCDDSLIGGFQLETHDTLVDNSYKRMLLQLYRRLIT